MQCEKGDAHVEGVGAVVDEEAADVAGLRDRPGGVGEVGAGRKVAGEERGVRIGEGGVEVGGGRVNEGCVEV